MKKKGLSRRNLFKYVGVGGATAVVAGCEKKPEKLIPVLVPPTNYEYTPHTAYRYMTTCQECNSGCGLMMTTREHRAQKAEGNPNHPINRGALCAKGQASLQTLYNPHRHAYPLQNGEKISWKAGLEKFNEIVKKDSGKIIFLGKPPSGSKGRFLDEWLQSVGGGERVNFEIISQDSQIETNKISFGTSEIADYAFEKAGIVINFGTDFLGNWGSSVENGRRFSDMHAYNNGDKNKLIHISPQVSLTGAKADKWIQIKPGTEGLVALAIARELRKKSRNYSFLEDFLDLYSPEKIVESTGIPTDTLNELVLDILNNGPLLALGGGNLSSTEQCVETLVAINILNAVSGSLGETLRFFEERETERSSHESIDRLVKDLENDKVKLLIIDDSNPVYALPNSSNFTKAIKKNFCDQFGFAKK